ncbi:large conductance mechanosensitive channel protein MscL [Microcella sp.]|uniref:large conductance mechanosensitive channel protein MscL n=1 Tax=Microcella sp. TaxID=1913979 RepID=UPI00391D2899
MLKGFKEFILRGNVVELAVAVVIGAAFTAVVNAIVNSVINPAIGALFNADDLASVAVITIATDNPDEPAIISFGAVLGALLQFLIVAAVVYFALVLPINTLKRRAEERRKAGEPAVSEDTPPTEAELLAEIRDLLAAQRGPSSER